jgi:hypothetical protein
MIANRFIGGAAAFATALLAGTALAASPSVSATHLAAVTLSATTNVRAISDAAAKQPHPMPTLKFEMPRHRYPQNAHFTAPLRLKAATTANIAIKSTAKAASAGFTGIYAGSNAAAIGGDVEPPDQGLAAAGNYVVEVVNLSFQVFSNLGNPITATIPLGSVLGAQSGDSFGDPHVEFDPTIQRWVIDTYLTNGNFNGFFLAVSTTTDPTGSYYVYRVDASTKGVKGCPSASACFPDYPQPGYDANAYYIAADLFSNATGGFATGAVYAIPLTPLLTGASFTYQRLLLNDFVIEPSIPAIPNQYATGANGTEFFMTARQISDGSNNLRVYAVTNTNAIGSGGTLVANYADVAAEPYASTVASTQPNVVGPLGQSLGATSASPLDGGYNAFGSGVKYLNGDLYSALTTAAVDGNGLDRNTVAWFHVRPSATGTSVSASIINQGYIVPPDGYSISYPGLALNRSGAGILGISVTNPNQSVPGGFPSAGYVKFTAGHPTSVYRITGQGGTSSDGFTCYPTYGGPPCRWGDFSSATMDPVTGIFYVGNEYIPDPSIFPRSTYANWGTFITEVK